MKYWGWTRSQQSSSSLGEDLERLLKRLDLLLAAGHAILVALDRVHALGLQLLPVRHSGCKLLLRAFEVHLLLLEARLLVLLRRGLELDIRRLGGLVDLRVGHELVVLLLILGLRGRGLRLQTREVGLDHLDHTDD